MTSLFSWLERHQIAGYLFAIALALLIGLQAPAISSHTAVLINPLLALLLYQTFLGVPMHNIRTAWRDHHFLSRLLLGNFLVAPALVWLLSRLFLTEAEPALLIGFVFVLVCPCVDYVLVFSDIAGGDTPRLTAATPLLMLCQMLLLPLYLRLFVGASVLESFSIRPFLAAFCFLIALPLALAALTQKTAQGQTTQHTGHPHPWQRGAHWLNQHGADSMVLVMMLTLFVVICSYVDQVQQHYSSLLRVAALYGLFAIGMCTAMSLLSRSLPQAQRVSLIFSGVTRNSLVILPLVLALPSAYALAVPTVLTQTLVELVCMIIMIYAVPRLFASKV